MPLTLHSPAFAPGEAIPARHTCEGKELSPPLEWRGLPAGTRSLALIVDDPDAPDPAHPRQVWVHWVAYNLPIGTHGLAEGAGNRDPEPPAAWGRTDGDTTGYHGPCPPIGRHRYFFRLYALDRVLPPLGPDGGRAELERAMARHVLEEAVLMGTSERARAP